jgi:hypothetical protein
LGLKNPDGGETAAVEDVTGCPAKVAIAGEANITMAKAASLFIFVFLRGIPRCCGRVNRQIDVVEVFCKEAHTARGGGRSSA